MCASAHQQPQQHCRHDNASNTSHSSVLCPCDSNVLNCVPWSWLQKVDARAVEQEGELVSVIGAELMQSESTSHRSQCAADNVESTVEPSHSVQCAADNVESTVEPSHRSQCAADNVSVELTADNADTHRHCGTETHSCRCDAALSCRRCSVEAVSSQTSVFQQSTEPAGVLCDKQPVHVHADDRQCETTDALTTTACHRLSDNKHTIFHTFDGSFSDRCEDDVIACDEVKLCELSMSLPDCSNCVKAAASLVKHCSETGTRKRTVNSGKYDCAGMQCIGRCKVSYTKWRRIDADADRLRSSLGTDDNCSRQCQLSSCIQSTDECSERKQTELNAVTADNSERKKLSDSIVLDDSSRRQEDCDVQLVSDVERAVLAVSEAEWRADCSEHVSRCECQPLTVSADCGSDDVIVDDTESSCGSDVSVVSGPSRPHAQQVSLSVCQPPAVLADCQELRVKCAQAVTCDVANGDDTESSCGSDVSVVSGPSRPHAQQVCLAVYLSVCLSVCLSISLSVWLSIYLTQISVSRWGLSALNYSIQYMSLKLSLVQNLKYSCVSAVCSLIIR